MGSGLSKNDDIDPIDALSIQKNDKVGITAKSNVVAFESKKQTKMKKTSIWQKMFNKK
jgi:hypothetical protein